MYLHYLVYKKKKCLLSDKAKLYRLVGLLFESKPKSKLLSKGTQLQSLAGAIVRNRDFISLRRLMRTQTLWTGMVVKLTI